LTARFIRIALRDSACPPEDCGGPWGYLEMLHILKNRRHPDYREWRELAGRDFQASAFDLKAVNREYASPFTRRTPEA
jgi:hypothetical protein